MKKLSVLLVVMIAVISLTACGSSGDQTPTEIATVAPTAAPTAALTTPPTQPSAPAPTEISTAVPTFAATEMSAEDASIPTAPTSPTDASASQEVSAEIGTADANGQKSLSGVITGMGGRTVVIKTANGREYEFDYSAADIEGSSDFITGASITVSYTGDVTGDELGQAVTITVA